MYYIGIICSQGHASSVALIRDRKVVAAIETERLSRKKFDDANPWKVLDHLFSSYSIKPEEVCGVGFAWNPWLTLKYQSKSFLKEFPHSLKYIFSAIPHKGNRSRISNFIRMVLFPWQLKWRYRLKCPFVWVDHHMAHAYSAYSMVKDKKRQTLLMVADGMGEADTTTIYRVSDAKFEKIYSKTYPSSLGIFYSAVTEFLGFTPDSDEFKVMGLSSYGSPHYYVQLKELVSISKNDFNFSPEYFGLHFNYARFYSMKFYKKFEMIKSFEQRADFAASAQKLFEEIILGLIEPQIQDSSTQIATAGGVFLNCVLNQKIRTKYPDRNLFFYPVAEDNGTAIGAASYVYHKMGGSHLDFDGNLYLGISLKQEKIASSYKVKIKKVIGLHEVAKLISDGKVVAWMQGRSEFGPRALGNRSILGDPRNPQMKDIMNKKIKLRESFRPFAPSILLESLQDYFVIPSGAIDFPYMIETVYAKEQTKSAAPAVVHVDGTSRIQSVSRVHNERYYDLINEFYKLTGLPIILNTSFNLNGMPIVASEEDALECFLNSEIDYLVIGDNLFERTL